MKKKFLLTLFFIILCLPVLTGCRNTNNKSSYFAEESMEFLSQAVDDVTLHSNSAVPGEIPAENLRRFSVLKSELEDVEEKIEHYDDYIESQYLQGGLSYTDYQAQEYELEKLEEKLNISEERLAYDFKAHK